MFKPFHQFVPGPEIWPNDLYVQVAKGCLDKDIIVEVTAGNFGRSTCLMTELLQHENKNPKFYTIDLFGTVPDPADGESLSGDTPWGESFADWSKRVGGDYRIIDSFDFYLSQCPTNKYLTDRVQFPPWHSSEEFDNGSVYFVMLNASRQYDAVLKQIELWAPKCAAHGKGLAIYGADNPNVQRAVQTFCGKFGMHYENRDNTLIPITNVPEDRLK